MNFFICFSRPGKVMKNEKIKLYHGKVMEINKFAYFDLMIQNYIFCDLFILSYLFFSFRAPPNSAEKSAPNHVRPALSLNYIYSSVNCIYSSVGSLPPEHAACICVCVIRPCFAH